MDLKEILVSLKIQEENLNLLFSTVNKKQRAIVENKIQDIEDSISAEEKLIKRIEERENSRIQLIKDFKKRLNLNTNSNSLAEFIAAIKDQLDPKFYNEVSLLRNSITVLTGKINYTNQINKILISQSISFIKATMTSLLDSKRKSLIDRRM